MRIQHNPSEPNWKLQPAAACPVSWIDALQSDSGRVRHNQRTRHPHCRKQRKPTTALHFNWSLGSFRRCSSSRNIRTDRNPTKPIFIMLLILRYRWNNYSTSWRLPTERWNRLHFDRGMLMVLRHIRWCWVNKQSSMHRSSRDWCLRNMPDIRCLL